MTLQSNVCVETVVNRVIDGMKYLINNGYVKSVIFVSDLKWADTPSEYGRGRYQCSPEVFREQVNEYNFRIEEKCIWSPNFIIFDYLVFGGIRRNMKYFWLSADTNT